MPGRGGGSTPDGGAERDGGPGLTGRRAAVGPDGARPGGAPPALRSPDAGPAGVARAGRGGGRGDRTAPVRGGGAAGAAWSGWPQRRGAAHSRRGVTASGWSVAARRSVGPVDVR